MNKATDVETKMRNIENFRHWSTWNKIQTQQTLDEKCAQLSAERQELFWFRFTTSLFAFWVPLSCFVAATLGCGLSVSGVSFALMVQPYHWSRLLVVRADRYHHLDHQHHLHRHACRALSPGGISCNVTPSSRKTIRVCSHSLIRSSIHSCPIWWTIWDSQKEKGKHAQGY